jgi:hypothetical protein
MPPFAAAAAAARVPAGALEDDAVLEAVVLLGALAGWQEGDRELADSGLVSAVCILLYRTVVGR